MKKVVFISNIPLNEQLEKFFFIGNLLISGFSVEYWDLTDIYIKKVKFSGSISRDYVKKYGNIKKFEQALNAEDIENVVFFTLINYSSKFLRLYRILTKAQCVMFHISFGALPSSFIRKSLTEKLAISMNKLFSPVKIYSYAINRIAYMLKKSRYIKHYDVVFCAGSAARMPHLKHSRVIPINHFDYDAYMLNRGKSRRLIEHDYCVFLDHNLAHHTDFKMFNKRSVTAEKYHQALKRFFDFVEDKYNIKVVIAAHPKSEYAADVFANRDIYKHRTCDLVKDCAFTIAHYSTSIAYSVLYKKPIVFIYTDEMKDLEYFDIIKTSAKTLNCSIYNVDHVNSSGEIQLKDVDVKSYDEYKYAYLVSRESENRSTNDVVLEYFKKL